MDLSDFDSSFRVGFSLTLEERASLEVEMHKRQLEERLERFVSARGRIPEWALRHLLTTAINYILQRSPSETPTLLNSRE